MGHICGQDRRRDRLGMPPTPDCRPGLGRRRSPAPPPAAKYPRQLRPVPMHPENRGDLSSPPPLPQHRPSASIFPGMPGLHNPNPGKRFIPRPSSGAPLRLARYPSITWEIAAVMFIDTEWGDTILVLILDVVGSASAGWFIDRVVKTNSGIGHNHRHFAARSANRRLQ